MPGPLPETHRRRRNAPTIPTTSLPAGGRTGPIPKPPKWTRLGASGSAWWRWAWRTPQAAGWASGHQSFVARRASLEDDLAAIDHIDSLDALDLLRAEDAQAFKLLIGRLSALVTGRLAIVREMREIDDRLGLTPKGMAVLRWEVVNVAAPPAADAADEVTERRDARRARLSAS